MTSRGAILFFFLLSFVCFGMRPLWEPDEGRYAEAARAMADTGDWLVPRLGGHAHLTKPPMAYWLTAGGIKILGHNEWGARLFLSLAFFGTLLSVVELGRAWGWKEREALASGVVFSTAILTFASGHILTTDMFLTFFETFGILCAWKVWTSAPRAGLWRLGFWGAFALAFLTKGPPGWLPLMAVAAFTWTRRNPARLFGIGEFLFFLAVSASWYLAIAIPRPELMEYFLKDEVYNRVFTTEHRRNNPPWIYPPLILAGLFPWVFLWPGLLTRTWRKVRAGLPRLSDIEFFSVAWIVLPLAVLTIAKSRMPLYVIPLYVPISLWAGRLLARDHVDRFLATARSRLWVRIAAGVWLAVLLTFVNYPDGAPRAKSNRAFGVALRDAPELRDPEATLSFLEDSSYHSIAFYARRSVATLGLDLKDAAKMFGDPTAFDPKSVFILRKSRMKKLKKAAADFHVIAEDHKLAAFTVTPKAAKPK